MLPIWLVVAVSNCRWANFDSMCFVACSAVAAQNLQQQKCRGAFQTHKLGTGNPFSDRSIRCCCPEFGLRFRIASTPTLLHCGMELRCRKGSEFAFSAHTWMRKLVRKGVACRCGAFLVFSQRNGVGSMAVVPRRTSKWKVGGLPSATVPMTSPLRTFWPFLTRISPDIRP